MSTFLIILASSFEETIAYDSFRFEIVFYIGSMREQSHLIVDRVIAVWIRHAFNYHDLKNSNDT